MTSFDKNLSSIRSLRNIKMSDRAGWLQPSSTVCRSTELNDVLTPRQLFRHKNNKQFIKNGRLTCLPAHRMINHAVKQIMRPTGGPIDMSSLQPKIICQIIAEWSTGEFSAALPKAWQGKTFTEMEKLVGHTYLRKVHIRDRYYMYTDGILTEPEGTKVETDTVIQFLLFVVRKQGGFKSYINECGKWRIDALGGVQKKLDHYASWPAEENGCPGKICRFCGVPNLFSRRDIKPSSKVLKSLNPHLPEDEVYDDTYNTEELSWQKNEKGVWYNEHPIAWRCRFCFSDLSYKPAKDVVGGYVDLVDQIVMHYVGGLLEQLKLTRVGDFYDDANESDKSAIMAHDMAIAKRLLVRLWSGSVVVPTNVTSNELVNLVRLAPQIDIIKSIKANCVCPSLHCEVAVLTGYMRSIFGNAQVLLDGSLIKLRDAGSTRYSNYSNWLQLEHTVESIGEPTQLHGVASLAKPREYFLQTANTMNGIYTIVPVETGLYNESATEIKIHSGEALWFVNSKTHPLTLNAKTWSMMNADVVKVMGGYHYNVTIQSGNFVKLVYTSSQLSLSPERFHWHEHEPGLQITLPLPCLAEMVDDELQIGVKCVRRLLNRELFRALCVRNMTGKMEFSALCQYAISFNMRRYTTGKVVLKQQHIDYELIHFHVFACIYSMKMQNNRVWMAKVLYQLMEKTDVKSLVMAAANNITEHLKLPEELKCIVTFVDTTSELLSRGAVPESLKLLHSAIPTRMNREMKLHDVFTFTTVGNVFTCPHHKSNCKHDYSAGGCVCCGAEAVGKLCECCKGGDYSSLLWGYTFNSAMHRMIMKINGWIKKTTTTNKLTNKPRRSNKPQRKTRDTIDDSELKNEEVIQQSIAQVAPSAQLLSNIISSILDGKPPVNLKKDITVLENQFTDVDVVEEMHEVLGAKFLHLIHSDDVSIFNTNTFEIYLPLMCSEYVALTNVKCSTEMIHVPNTQVDNCGYEAYKYLTNTNMTDEDFRVLVGGQAPFDESQIFYAAEAENINLALLNIEDNSIRVVRNNTFDAYFTMAYLPPKPGAEIGHFSPVKIKFTAKPKYYMAEPTVPLQLRADSLHKDNKDFWLYNFDGAVADNLSLELTLKLTTMSAGINDAQEVESAVINGKTFITNSDKHDLQHNKFNFEMVLHPELADHVTGKTIDLNHRLFQSHLTIPKAIPFDLTQLHKLCVIDEVLKMVKTTHALLKKDSQACTFINQRRVVVSGKLQVTLQGGYVKPLDKVGIKHKDGSVSILTVKSTNGSIALLEDLGTDDKFTLIVPKNSIMSNLKRISALQSATRDGQWLSSLLSNARSVDGFGGAGKSQEILQLRTSNSMVLTATTVAKNNLISRGYSAQQVKTLERASWDRSTIVTSLFIDEANMVDYLDLSVCIPVDVTSINLYYDSTQISKFDAVNLQGEVGVRIITDYPRHTEHWHFSRRFGGELTTALQKVLPQLESNTNKETSFSVKNLSALDEHSFKELVDEFKPTVVLHFYTVETNLLNTWLRNFASEFVATEDEPINPYSDVKAMKAHSFQSYESSRVLIIQWRTSNTNMGLCRDKKYVVSACTRAQNAAMLVSIGHITQITGVADAVAVLGGNPVLLKDWLEFDLEKTSDMLNDCLKQELVTSKVNNKELWLYRGSAYVGKYYKLSGKWVGHSHIPMVGDRLTSGLNEKPGASVQNKVINGTVRTLSVTSRVRALGWVNDLIVNDGKLQLGGTLSSITVKKTPGCPYMCGLTMYKSGVPVIVITDGWSGTLDRAITSVEGDELVDKMVTWFEGGNSGTWLDHIAFDGKMEFHMMMDRALTLPFALLQLQTEGRGKLSANTSKDNAYWKNLVLTKHNLPTNNRWRSAVRHTMLVYKWRMSNNVTGTFYSIASIQYKRNFSTWSSEDVWIDVFNTALSTVSPVMRRNRAIGAYGMYMAPEDHMMKDTQVGAFLKQRKITMELRAKDSVKLTVVTSSPASAESTAIMALEKITTDVISHNAACLTTYKHELVDSYALTKFGVQGEGVRVGYLGLNAHLNPVSNRHYISVIKPNSDHLEPFWLASLDTTKTWYFEYEQRLKETVIAKAEQLKSQAGKLNDGQRVEATEMLTTLKKKSTKALNIVTMADETDITIVGCVAATLSCEDLVTLVKSSSALLICVPTKRGPNVGNDCLMPEVSVTLNDHIMNAVIGGELQLDKATLRFNTIDTLAGFAFVHVFVAKPTLVRNINVHKAQNPTVSLKVPFIDWENLTNDKPLLTTKTGLVDKRLIDRLLNYSIANKPTNDKIMAYVRSLLSTYDTNRTGIYPTYDVTIEVAANSAMVALLLYRVNYSGVLSLASLAFDNVELLRPLLALQNTINKNNGVTDLTTGFIENSLKFINVDVRALAKSIEELEVSIKTTRPMIRAIRIADAPTYAVPGVVDPSDDDSSDKSSDDSKSTSHKSDSTSYDNSVETDSDDDSLGPDQAHADNAQTDGENESLATNQENESVRSQQSEALSFLTTNEFDSHLNEEIGPTPTTNFIPTSINLDPMVDSSVEAGMVNPINALNMRTTTPKVSLNQFKTEESLARVVSIGNPGYSFDASKLIGVTTKMLLDVANAPSSEAESTTVWTYWQSSGDKQQDNFVHRCVQHNRKMTSGKVIILNETNESKYVHPTLFKFKRLVTVQCWSDLVRMWLLTHFGGVWIDASVLLDPKWGDPLDWIANGPGMLFYQTMQDEIYVLENWMMSVRKNSMFMKFWFSCFLFIVKNGNSVKEAEADLSTIVENPLLNVDINEDYLTMHESSKIAARGCALDGFVMLPGFAGPLGWITEGINLTKWLNSVLTQNWKPQGGAVKMIGLSREIVCSWEKDTKQDFTKLFCDNKLDADVLIISVGTRGDVEASKGLAKQLQDAGVSNDLIVVSNAIFQGNFEQIQLAQDLLAISDVTSLGGAADALQVVKDLFTKLTTKLNGKSYKYLYANYSVPCMVQMARLVGAIPINYTATPSFEDGSTAHGYFTMHKSNEKPYKLAIDSLTNKVALDSQLPLNSDSIMHGVATLPTIRCSDPRLIDTDRIVVNTFTVGNMVNGSNFSGPEDIIVRQQVGLGNKVDVIVPGPLVTVDLFARIDQKLSRTTKLSKNAIVVSSQVHNMTKKMKGKSLRKIRRHYNGVKFIDKLNLLSLTGKVLNVFSHGGVGTRTDALYIGAEHHGFGILVDQPYWNNMPVNQSATPVAKMSEVISYLHNKNIPKLTGGPCELLMSRAFGDSIKLTKSRGKCTSSIVYSPLVVRDCVKNCFSKRLEQLQTDWNSMALNTMEPLMQLNDIVKASMLQNLNLVLIKDNNFEKYVWNSSFPEIVIEITMMENLDHANLSNLFVQTECLECPSASISVGLQDAVIGDFIGENNNATFGLQEFVRSGSMTRMFDSVNLGSKLHFTQLSDKIDVRASRTSNPCTLCTVDLSEDNVCTITGDIPTRGKLLAVLDRDGWSYGICSLHVSGTCYLTTERIVAGAELLCIDLGCRVLEVPKQTTRVNLEGGAKPLNIQTLNQLKKITSTFDYDNKLAKAKEDHIVVYSYDNRGHDKYDEANVIATANVVTWLGDEPNEASLATMLETYNKPNRLVYYNGKLSWRFNIVHYGYSYLVRAFAIERDLPYYLQAGCVVEGDVTGWDNMDLLRFVEAETSPEFALDGDLITKTRKEWMTALGVYGSAFDEISSRTMVERDENYTMKIKKAFISIPKSGEWGDLCAQNYVYLSKTMFFSARQKIWFTKPSTGGEGFVNEEKISLGNSGDWWKKIGDSAPILKDLEENPLVVNMIDTDMTLNSAVWSPKLSMDYMMEEPVADEEISFDIMISGPNEYFDEVVPHDIQDLWNNTDLSMDLRQYAPINVANVRSKENPDKIRPTNKALLNNPTPMESRPILSKWTFEEHRAITGRILSKLRLRNLEKTLGAKERVNKFVKCYFGDNFSAYNNTSQILDVDAYETMLWISKRRDGLKIAKELNDMFTDELGLIPLNAINVHMKLESLMKEKPIMHWGQHQARGIYWQRKAIAAISSPVFLKIKSRLKNSLRDKYVYADGLTPGELNQKCRNTTNVNWFFENDLSKQDRQTDKPLIEVEMRLYALLGASPSLLKWWRTMHEQWKFRARWNKGQAEEMRLTGQSTTAIGNLITNMQVHNDFFLKNDHIVKRVLFLGDDVLVMLSDKPDVSSLSKETKEKHNMVSKQRLSADGGIFCCMIAYKNSQGGCELGPDYVRLRYRFEVTNGVSEATPENIQSRCQSYACMVGKTPEMVSLMRSKGWILPLQHWYDGINLPIAIAKRYDLNEHDVMNNYAILVDYLTSPEPINVEFSTYTNVKVY